MSKTSGSLARSPREFKAVLVSNPESTVPDWVRERLANDGIEFLYHECQTGNEVVEVAGDADVVWIKTSHHLLTAETIESLPRCLAILRSGSGTDNVDVEAATKAGIVVANTPDAVAETTSDHAIALLFSVVRLIPYNDRLMRTGRWGLPAAAPTQQLYGRTLGLVGFGRIGRRVAQKISGFDMKVLAFDPFVSKETIEEVGASKVTLDELLRRADFVSLHSPLTPETFHLIGERELRLMRPEAYLINCARGAIVDEGALYRALTEGWIAGAGSDVMEEEPPNLDNPLFQLDNMVSNPHIASVSDTMRHQMWRLSVETIIDLHQGTWPRSVVNPTVRPRRNLSPRSGS